MTIGLNLKSIGRCVGLAAVAGLHASALWAILKVETVRDVAREATPIFVSFVKPETEPTSLPPAEIKPPEPLPLAKPKPIKKAKPKPVAPPKVPAMAPVVAAETQTPVPVEVAQPEPAPRVEPPAPPPVAERQPAPPPPPSLEPPRFDMAYLNNPAPTYPAYSRRLGEEGRVLLRVLVSEEGLAQKVEIKASSGSARLDQAAMEAVKEWRFIPARRGDTPIEDWALVPINFELS